MLAAIQSNSLLLQYLGFMAVKFWNVISLIIIT